MSTGLDVVLELLHVLPLLNYAFNLAESVRKVPSLICKQATLAIFSWQPLIW